MKTLLTNLINGRLATRLKSFLRPSCVMTAIRETVTDGRVTRQATGTFIRGLAASRWNVLVEGDCVVYRLKGGDA
jgi:hypothetical protein